MKKLPRVLAFHDMSGFGKCSLSVALPVISACGAEVCPLPTALLSSNTHFKGFTFTDFTPHIEAYYSHWAAMGLQADALYSGFLGSAAQIVHLRRIASLFAPGLIVIDPVMGDNGQIYKTYTPELCAGMKELCAIAHVLTPNLTEAAFLCGESYAPEDVSPARVEALCRKLQGLGARNVVLTGIERGDILYNCVLASDGVYTECAVELLTERMHGTGDLFASVLTGKLLTGMSLADAVRIAAEFVLLSMKESYQTEEYKVRGVCFEPLLHRLRPDA